LIETALDYRFFLVTDDDPFERLTQSSFSENLACEPGFRDGGGRSRYGGHLDDELDVVIRSLYFFDSELGGAAVLALHTPWRGAG
jgi:hypothetical protein